MNLSINTTAIANSSRLTKDELAAIIDKIDGDDVLPRDELLEIAETLLENDKKTYAKHNISQMVYFLKNQPRINLKQVQSVLTDYAIRARDGKVGGGSRSRRLRKKTPRKASRSRKIAKKMRR
jgi:hypothetical protein